MGYRRGILLKLAVVYILPLIAGSILVVVHGESNPYWLAVGLFVVVYHVGYSSKVLSKQEVSLTPGYLLTVSRGSLTVLIGAFIFVPSPWSVVVLYGILLISDYLDGYIARLGNEDTELRRELDNEFDSIALLIVITVGISYGRFPLWFLSVGLLKYVYSFGLYLRLTKGKRVRDLPDRKSRRLIGGMVTVFAWIGMIPILESRIVFLGAVPITGLVLYSFARDWYLVTRTEGGTQLSERP